MNVSQLIEKWQKDSISEIKFIELKNNIVTFKINDQKFNMIIPEGYPSSNGIIMLDYDQILSGYEFLSDIHSRIFDINKDIISLLEEINRVYLESISVVSDENNDEFGDDDEFEDDSEFEDDEFVLNDNDIELFMNDIYIINTFDIQEIKLKKNIHQKLSESLKSLEKNKENIRDNEINSVPILFSTKSCGNILINEFFNLRKKYRRNNRFDIEVIDNNIFHWKLLLKNFSSIRLKHSLSNIYKNHGYKHIEVHIRFHLKLLYPSFPPSISIIKPNLSNMLSQRIPNIKLFQFQYWSPCKNMEDVINKLYNIINKHGVIEEDVNDTHNVINHELEKLLIHLASLCNIDSEYDPIDDEIYIKIYGNLKKQHISQTCNFSSIAKQSTSFFQNDSEAHISEPKTPKRYWKSGTGYGHRGLNSWNVEEYRRLQIEKDIKIQSILRQVIEIIQKSNMSNICQTLKMSQLIPVVKSYLKGTTLLDIDNHKDLYKLLFILIQNLAEERSIYLFDDNTNKSLYNILSDINKEAIETLKMCDKFDTQGLSIKMAHTINTVFEMIKPCYMIYMEKCKKIDKNKQKIIKQKITQYNSGEFGKKYVDMLFKMKYDMGEIKNFTKRYDEVLYTIDSATKNHIKRLIKEYASINKNLPIYYQSSIFVRVEKTNIRCMRVLITGPDNTPYDSGIFIFDVYITDKYPHEPPKMRFLNNGGKRFNPNVKKKGQLCLSLLGTWSGDGGGGESWNKNTSTLQQLFISVQSLVLIETPVFNEPSQENLIGTIEGDKKNKIYNQYIRYYTMCHTMCEILQNVDQYPTLKDVIINHFKLKKDYILKNCQKWVDTSYSLTGSLQHVGNLTKTMFQLKFKELKNELIKLD